MFDVEGARKQLMIWEARGYFRDPVKREIMVMTELSLDEIERLRRNYECEGPVVE